MWGPSEISSASMCSVQDWECTADMSHHHLPSKGNTQHRATRACFQSAGEEYTNENVRYSFKGEELEVHSPDPFPRGRNRIVITCMLHSPTPAAVSQIYRRCNVECMINSTSNNHLSRARSRSARAQFLSIGLPVVTAPDRARCSVDNAYTRTRE